MPPLRRRAYLGLELTLSTTDPPLLLIDHLDENAPGARAGLRVGDAILSIAGQTLTDLNHVRRLVADLEHAAPTPIDLLRDGSPLTLHVEPEPLATEQLPEGQIALDEVQWGPHRLRAIWSWPAHPGPHPLVWLLPGATWLSEEHPTTPWHPIRKLVTQLTAAGVATLRLERSGLGDSEGPACTELDLEAELAGFRCGFELIEREPRVHAQRVFVFGRSLGGMFAPCVVAGHSVAGVAVWGTSARRWDDAMLRASVRQWRLSGVDDPRIERRRAQLHALQTLVYVEGLTPAQAFERRPDLRGLLDDAFSDRYVYGRVASYFQQLQAKDIAAAYAALDAPLLALHGSCDWLSELEDLEHIAQRCAPRSRLVQLPGVDHLMHLRGSLEEAFATMWGGDFSPAVGEALIDFVRKPEVSAAAKRRRGATGSAAAKRRRGATGSAAAKRRRGAIN